MTAFLSSIIFGKYVHLLGFLTIPTAASCEAFSLESNHYDLRLMMDCNAGKQSQPLWLQV